MEEGVWECGFTGGSLRKIVRLRIYGGRAGWRFDSRSIIPMETAKTWCC